MKLEDSKTITRELVITTLEAYQQSRTLDELLRAKANILIESIKHELFHEKENKGK